MNKSEYQEYLSSPLWLEEIRPRILKRDRGLCVICGLDAREVHHHDYSEATMCGKNDSALVSLCVSCHEMIEFDESKQRVELVEKRKLFDQLKKLHQRALREGLLLLARVTKRDLWTTIVFEWANSNFEGRLEEIETVLQALRGVWQKEARFARRFHSRFHNKAGAKLYIRNTKNVGAIFRIKGTLAEVKYRAAMLRNPLPYLKRTLSKERDKMSKCNAETRKRMARLLGSSLKRHYKIKIKVPDKV